MLKQINKHFNNQIENAGLQDNIPYVKLKNGKFFFSHLTENYQIRFTFLLKKNIRCKVPVECYNVLYDLVFRYVAPEKEKDKLKNGKYYDLKEGDVVMEIGAYIGYYAMKISELVGTSGKIIAVEAIKSNYDIMNKNISFNQLSTIVPINKAVWKEHCQLQFYIKNKQKNSAVKEIIENPETVEVEGDTIDNIVHDYQLNRVDFIRIQVNGAEKEALEGMKNTLKLKPKLLIAVPYMNRDIITKQLDSLGYNTEQTPHSIFAYSK